jgi:hypothetical protein
MDYRERANYEEGEVGISFGSKPGSGFPSSYFVVFSMFNFVR